MTIKEFKIQNALGLISLHMKYELVYDHNTPTEILTILSKDKNWHIRSYVVDNPNTPIGILKTLSNDADWFVSCEAVDNLAKRKTYRQTNRGII